METTRTAAAPKKLAAEELVEMCSVRVGDRMFGMSIQYILEIVGGARPQRVPLAPAFVGGLVHYRGDVLTTVSLRHLLGLLAHGGSQALLVVECAGGRYGLLVDSVGEVLQVSSAEFEPNPSTMQEHRRALFAGAYKLKDSLMVMLNPENLDPMQLAKTN